MVYLTKTNGDLIWLVVVWNILEHLDDVSKQI